MSAQEERHVGLLSRAFSHREDDIHQPFLIRRDLNIVEFEEHEGRDRARPLVAIHERVILHDMKEVGGGHLEEIAVQVIFADRGLRDRDRRLQQAGVSDAWTPAVALDLIAVNLNNLGDGEEERGQ